MPFPVYVMMLFVRYNACCEAMHALQRRGANVHARETAGELPLHVASLYLADQAVDLLLRYFLGYYVLCEISVQSSVLL